MHTSTKKRRQRIIATGVVSLALLVLGACVTPPAGLSPRPADVLPASPRAPMPAPLETKRATPPPQEIRREEVLAGAEREPAVVAAAPPAYIESSASYYAKKFNGRRTASGERYNPNQMTAATRDFPLQSWIKVINPANGKEVIVRINDRTGKRKTPLIDLSLAAAKELGFWGRGKIHVHVLPILPTAINR